MGGVVNNMGMTKGGQKIMLSGVNRIRPHDYTHRHKLHNITTGWTIVVQVEVIIVVEAL